MGKKSGRSKAMTQTAVLPKKTVRVIEPTVRLDSLDGIPLGNLKRVAAYCRVSTKQEEQLNSYEVQKRYYTEKIHREIGWQLVDIYADKGISGTSTKNRDEFNKMIRNCRRHKIDMIITKSISRFARNTLDCIKYIRLLKELNVDVYFEEQNLHSTDVGAEFYITIYGCIAQTESENISSNVAWSKAQSAKAGNVSFTTSFFGYRKGANGTPEIVPEEAETVQYIYREFLAGKSMKTIADALTEKGIPTPMNKTKWQPERIRSILTNEKYKGDALLGKTYIENFISKKVRKNNGERPMYYVENNHPAIIDKITFGRVQEELSRRSSIKKRRQKNTKTALGKYSSKYALTDLLVCGECGTPYRRCTWTIKGQKKIVWRCISRLEFGKKYCHESPTMDEDKLQSAIMNAIMQTAKMNPEVLLTLKGHIETKLCGECYSDGGIELQLQIQQIEKEFKGILSSVTAENQASVLTDPKLTALISEKRRLENELEVYKAECENRENTTPRLQEIFTILDGMKNHPLAYDDQIIRQILRTIIVESKTKIKIVFVGGFEVESGVEK